MEKDTFLTLKRLEAKLDYYFTQTIKSNPECLIYEAMFYQFPWGVSLSEINGKIVTVNEQMCEILKGSKEEIIRNQASFYYINKEFRKKLLDQIKLKGHIYNYEVQIKRNDFEVIWINLNMKIITIRNNEYIITIIEDITEIKQAGL